MLSQDAALKLFAEQLNSWSPADLKKAVAGNMSLAREIQLHNSSQLQVWRNLASTYRLLSRRDYDQFVRSINYHNVLRAVRQANPQLATAVETTPRADGWLLNQIGEIRKLIFG